MARNFRPISLTSVCCKTLEHIICEHMLNQLKNKILSPLQHRFCNSHSFESQLILVMHEIMRHLDSKQQTDLIILDFSKAFDTVFHNINAYGINQSINQSSLFPGQHVQKVQFTVIHVQGNHVHLKEHLTCKTNFTN